VTLDVVKAQRLPRPQTRHLHVNPLHFLIRATGDWTLRLTLVVTPCGSG
jgi:hypothetical protein